MLKAMGFAAVTPRAFAPSGSGPTSPETRLIDKEERRLRIAAATEPRLDVPCTADRFPSSRPSFSREEHVEVGLFEFPVYVNRA